MPKQAYVGALNKLPININMKRVRKAKFEPKITVSELYRLVNSWGCSEIQYNNILSERIARKKASCEQETRSKSNFIHYHHVWRKKRTASKEKPQIHCVI